MQPIADLQNTWIMFEHVKCVASSITMACHMYDPTYYKMMTIVICDLQYEDTKIQQIMWTKLNEMLLKHGFPNSNFKDSCMIAHKPIQTWSKLLIVWGTPMLG
jgi:hypothetical protein